MRKTQHHPKNGRLMVFTGNASLVLAKDICRILRCNLGMHETTRFSDGELWYKYGENIRGADVYLIQSTYAPSDNLLELLIMCDAARRASAQRVNVVIPYFGYARQDRKDQPRVAITAKLVANMLVAAGADRILTMDLHAPQIQGFFDIPFEHLYSVPIMTDVVKKSMRHEVMLVSPDVGGTIMARAYAKRLNAPMALIDKRRIRHNVVEAMQVIGDVTHKHCLLVDDLCDTAGTLVRAASHLMERGAASVSACFTHPVLSGDAVARLNASPIKRIYCTDTIPLIEVKRSPKIKVISVAKLFAKAIEGIHHDESISTLFK